MVESKQFFSGDRKYMSPLTEDGNGFFSVTNMTDEELDHSILEQFLIFIMEYKTEKVQLADFLSSLRVEDCENTFISKVPDDSRLIERHRQILIREARYKGRCLYMKIRSRICTRLGLMVESGQIYTDSDMTYSIFGPDHNSGEIKYQVMQSIMDLVGVWWDGFTVPEGTACIGLTDKGKILLENNSIEDIAKILEYELIHGQTDETKIN